MQTTVELGATAEARAVTALVARGYVIVERNYRCKAGELDIVARAHDRAGQDVLVFVEVRSRSDAEHGSASEAVGRTKQRRVARVAAAYLAQVRPEFEACRFDVVAITGDDVAVFEDAWRLGW